MPALKGMKSQLNEQVNALSGKNEKTRGSWQAKYIRRFHALSFLRLRKSAYRIRQITNVFLKYGFGKVIDQSILVGYSFRKEDQDLYSGPR